MIISHFYDLRCENWVGLHRFWERCQKTPVKQTAEARPLPQWVTIPIWTTASKPKFSCCYGKEFNTETRQSFLVPFGVPKGRHYMLSLRDMKRKDLWEIYKHDIAPYHVLALRF